MRKPLPKSGFKWVQLLPEESRILEKKEKAKRGWILQVDLEYPQELYEEHNSYPLAPEKKVVLKEWMSPYVTTDTQKLLLTLQDKKNYVVHYRNLQFYLAQGMKLKKDHRALEFDQERWMEPYIRMNTNFRKKAKNTFEKDFFKLINNFVFGKTVENLRKRVDIRLVRSHENKKIRKLVASPLYSRHEFFANKIARIEMHKSRLSLNKPAYTGMTILENSKILMYDFFYNILKKQYGPRCELLYSATDSLLLDIETEDVYKDMGARADLFDTSDYTQDHPLHSDVNEKVLGK